MAAMRGSSACSPRRRNVRCMRSFRFGDYDIERYCTRVTVSGRYDPVVVIRQAVAGYFACGLGKSDRETFAFAQYKSSALPIISINYKYQNSCLSCAPVRGRMVTLRRAASLRLRSSLSLYVTSLRLKFQNRFAAIENVSSSIAGVSAAIHPLTKPWSLRRFEPSHRRTTC